MRQRPQQCLQLAVSLSTATDARSVPCPCAQAALRLTAASQALKNPHLVARGLYVGVLGDAAGGLHGLHGEAALPGGPVGAGLDQAPRLQRRALQLAPGCSAAHSAGCSRQAACTCAESCVRSMSCNLFTGEHQCTQLEKAGARCARSSCCRPVLLTLWVAVSSVWCCCCHGVQEVCCSCLRCVRFGCTEMGHA